MRSKAAAAAAARDMEAAARQAEQRSNAQGEGREKSWSLRVAEILLSGACGKPFLSPAPLTAFPRPNGVWGV